MSIKCRIATRESGKFEAFHFPSSEGIILASRTPDTLTPR